MPQTLQAAWTRLERIQHLAVYGECLGKTACSIWHVPSHYCALLAWWRWVTCKEKSTPMTRHSYRKRDYAFGQVMLKLRTSIGLTQAGLANLLGVSRRAVGEWEGGLNYPKAGHLQQLITLCVQQHVFAPEREEEQIRALWKTAQHRVLLDETWLSALLSTSTTPVFTSITEVRTSPGPTPAMESAAFPRIDWVGALDVSRFTGREIELAELSRWIVQEQCRLVAILGMGGIGKSALVSLLGKQLAPQFDAVLWCSLRDAPSCEELVANCLTFFSETPPAEFPPLLEQRIKQLIGRLQERRCLLVLDNLEMLLEEEDPEGNYRTGYQSYGRLIERLGESAHRSCVVLTSREKPREIEAMEGPRGPVRSLRLLGLSEEAARCLLEDKELRGVSSAWQQLIATYAGNPLALKIVGQAIVDLFAGEIVPFLQSGELIFNGIRVVLRQQVARLTLGPSLDWGDALDVPAFNGRKGAGDATMSEAVLLRDQLLTTKFFIPSPSHAFIPRPRLTAQLSASLQHKLTLISAPPGFGKTTLLSAWVQSLPSGNPHVAWVSLDEGDNDPLRFWEYGLTALDTCKPGLCTFLLTFLHTEQSLSVHYLLTALINTLVKQTEQFLLILDDYHVITQPEVHGSLAYLLEHLPPQLHIILATRADPPLSLSRLRARDQVFELRTEQLRCTSEEVSAFFTQAMRIPLTSGEIRDVEVRTEGWMAGLQLLALSMRGHTDPSVLLAEVHGTHHYILDYLTDEVLRQQPTALQTFLLRTSILERLCASLCDRVMGQSGSQLVLEHLEQANLFVVSLDERRQWYRYHALFAEALCYRLQQAEGEAVAALHLRASQWYDQQGNLNEAVRHAVSAGDWQRIADLIEPAHAVIWSSHEHAMLRRWLEQLPVEVVRSRPRLCLAYAKILYQVAPYNPMERWLHDAETAVRAILSAATSGDAETGALPLTDQREWDDLLGEIASFRAAVTAFTLGDGHSALAFCEEALAHLPPQNVVARAEVAYAKSLAYHALGDIVPAIQSAREATAQAQALGTILAYMCRTAYSLRLHGKLHEVVQIAQLVATRGTTSVELPHAMVCWAYIIHADVLREWNRLDEALALALQGIQLSEQTEMIVALYFAYSVLMRVYQAQGEMDSARLAFQKSEATLAQNYSPYRRSIFLIADWVQFWLADGEVERATLWAQELVQQPRELSPLAREREDVARARILLAQKKPTEALSLLEPLRGGAERQERWNHVIEMKVLQALAHFMDDEEQEALAVLTQAMQLAEPEGYVRIFVDESTPMASILSRLKEQEDKQVPSAYLDTVLAAFPQNYRTHEDP